MVGSSVVGQVPVVQVPVVQVPVVSGQVDLRVVVVPGQVGLRVVDVHGHVVLRVVVESGQVVLRVVSVVHGHGVVVLGHGVVVDSIISGHTSDSMHCNPLNFIPIGHDCSTLFKPFPVYSQIKYCEQSAGLTKYPDRLQLYTQSLIFVSNT